MNKYSILNCFFLIFLFFSCTNSKMTENANVPYLSPRDSSLLNERALLKKYALCKCLIVNFPSDTSLVNDGSLMGYIETGTYGSKAYDIVDSFILKKSLVKYNSKHHNHLYLMKCIDIYNSPELDSIVIRVDKYLNQNLDQEGFSK